MPTANEDLLDAAVRHQVSLLRFSEGEAKRAVALLKKGEKELAEAIANGLSEFSQARINGLLADVRRLRSALVDQLKDQLTDSLHGLAETEAKWEKDTLEAVVPVEHAFNAVTPQALKSVVSSPIQGIPLEGWLDNLKQGDIRRIEQQVNLGFLQGETIPQITRRVLDTGAATTRRNAEALARTAVNHVSQNARATVWDANSDIIDGLRWTATLDGRTTEVCMSRDGTVYPIDPKSPKPPAHFQCRSLLVAVLDGIAIVGDRPYVKDTRTRRARETDFRKEAQAAAGDKWKGMTEAERRAAIKAQRDKWTAENIGQVPAKTSYNDWLRRQPTEFQDEVLGKGKADLFRGGVTLDKFVDEKGQPYTLDELKAKYASDAMNVQQPGVGLKAKAYLQKGLSNEQVLLKIAEEYPDAKTSLGSIASYKSELKKLGALDELAGTGSAAAVGTAKNVQELVDSFDNALPAGVKHALGGQWANVVEDLDGSAGAYGFYSAGKGVQLSAKKLGKVPAAQAQQVIAHELGHLLHKQHGVKMMDFTFNGMLETAKTLSDNGKKAYAYYLSHPDELVAEIFAQAISPSPLTSQGLSALEFKQKFGPHINHLKHQVEIKFYQPPPTAPAPVKGPPVATYEVAGTHNTVGGLAKALLQQGMPDEEVILAVKAQFPNAKTGLNSIKSYKSELKKAGLLKAPGQGPTVVATKPVPTMPPPVQAEVKMAAPKAAEPPAGPQPLPPGSSLKLQAEKLFAQGVLDNHQVAELLKKNWVIPPNQVIPKASNVASWKTTWKKYNAGAASQATAKATKTAAKAAATGPKPTPKLLGKPMGGPSTKVLEYTKSLYANGAKFDQGFEMAAKGTFGAMADKEKYKDIWELAVYQVDTAKAAGKPYLNASMQSPAIKLKPQVPTNTWSKVDMTPARKANTPVEGWPPPPRFTYEQQKAAMEKLHHMDVSGLQKANAEQKRLGLPELTDVEYSAIRGYTSNVAFKLNKMLRDSHYAKDYHLQAFVEAAQSAIRKLPKHDTNEILSRGVGIGFADEKAFFNTYKVGSVVEEASFISTSYGGKAAFDKNVIFKFKHKNGVRIDQFSHYRSEREVLLAPGTRIRVTKVEKGKDGKLAIVHVEEI